MLLARATSQAPVASTTSWDNGGLTKVTNDKSIQNGTPIYNRFQADGDLLVEIGMIGNAFGFARVYRRVATGVQKPA